MDTDRLGNEAMPLPTTVLDQAADYAFCVHETRSAQPGSHAVNLLAERMFLGMKGWSLTETDSPLSEALLAVAAGTVPHPALEAALERRFRGLSALEASPLP